MRVAYAGSATDGRRWVQPLREVAPRILDTVDDMPYRAVGTIHNDPTDPMPAYDTSALLGELDHDTVDTLLEIGGPEAQAPYVVELRHLGGAFARPPAVPNPVGHRDAAFSVFCASLVDPAQAEQMEAIEAAHQRLHDRLRPWSTGGVPVSFMGMGDAPPERVRMAYQPADYARLVELKTRFDPDNIFRINHNIPPDPNPDPAGGVGGHDPDERAARDEPG